MNILNYAQMDQAQQMTALLNDPKFATIMILLSLWALVWKGFALWKASQNKSKPWFIALLIINSVGILEIIYIFYFSKKGKKVE